MSRSPTRDERYSVLRSSERRLAEAGLATAQADLARLTALSQRIEQLRRTMHQAVGATRTLDLHLMGEMADHLLRASGALEAPIQAAEYLRNHRSAEVARTTARETGLQTRLDEARRAADRAAEFRADANRISAQRGPKLRLVGGDAL